MLLLLIPSKLLMEDKREDILFVNEHGTKKELHVSQMAPYYLYSALIWTLWTLVKSRALNRV
jgi:hypothetical protein